MRNALLALALIAPFAQAEQVYLSAHGKTFHKTADCSVLSRSKVKLTADRKVAEDHGRTPCGRCYNPKPKSAGTAGWAQAVK